MEHFAALPGIGRKSAARLAYFVLDMPQEQAADFAASILEAKKAIHNCKVCQNLTDKEVCDICASDKRDDSVICVVESPRDVAAFERLQETYGEDLALVAVNSGEDEATVAGFLEENGYTFPVVLDPEYAVSSLYPTEGIPYTVIIGTDGKVASIQLGAGDADAMYEHYCELIDGLLAA